MIWVGLTIYLVSAVACGIYLLWPQPKREMPKAAPVYDCSGFVEDVFKKAGMHHPYAYEESLPIAYRGQVGKHTDFGGMPLLVSSWAPRNRLIMAETSWLETMLSDEWNDAPFSGSPHLPEPMFAFGFPPLTFPFDHEAWRAAYARYLNDEVLPGWKSGPMHFVWGEELVSNKVMVTGTFTEAEERIVREATEPTYYERSPNTGTEMKDV